MSDKHDKSVLKSVIREGEGYSTPNDGARCVINLRGMERSGRVFDNRQDVEFELGDGISKNVCGGIEMALTKMKKAELAKLKIRPQHAWGIAGNAEFGLAPSTDVVYEVELTSFEKPKESWQLNSSEKLEQATLLKNKGADLFKEGKYSLALKKYTRMSQYLKGETFDTDEQKDLSKKLHVAGELNVAACNLKLKENRATIEACTNVLEMEPKNEKALFRMAQAYAGLSEYDEAMRFFGLVLEVNPTNRDASAQIAICKQKIKEHRDKEKAIYSKMFK